MKAHWWVLLFLVPLAAAEPERFHVHDEYVIPYNVQLSGVGGGLFQGATMVYVTYDAVLPDSDEADALDAVYGHLTVTAYGPGNNIVAANASSSVILSTTGCTVTSVATSSGVATTRSHHTQTWRVDFDGSTIDRDRCDVLIRISNTGATAYVLDAPVTIYNADGQPVELRDFEAWSALVFLGLMLLALMRGWLLTAGASTIAFLGTFYAAFPFGVTGAFFLIVLALWLEALAKGRIYSFFEKEKQHE